MVSKDQKRWSLAANIIMMICSVAAILPFLLLIIASFTDDKTAILNGYSYFGNRNNCIDHHHIVACLYVVKTKTSGCENIEFPCDFHDVV